MISSSAPPVASGLHTRRCARHPAREAAARCPGCADFFCRECVVEHDGKLLCAVCLARGTAGGASPRAVRFAGVRRAARLAAGAAALTGFFYGMGAALRTLPGAVHDGTVWKKIADGDFTNRGGRARR